MKVSQLLAMQKQETEKLAEHAALLAEAAKTNRPLNTEERAKADEIEAEIKAIRATASAAKIQSDGAKVSATFTGGTDLASERPWAEGKAGLGEFAMAVQRAHTGNGTDPRLLATATGMGEATGPDGGFAVPIEYAAGIEKEMYETGQVLSLVDAREISGNAISYTVQKETSRADGSRQGGVLGYWVDEGEAPDASKFQLAKIEMKLRKVAALGYLTEELAQDAVALGGELQNAFAEELIFQVENKIFRGSGVGSPLGFLNAPCFVSVAKETSQTAATINTTNLSKMWARLPARSKSKSVWLINGDCETSLDALALPAGTAALQPRFVDYGPAGVLRIKGRPVVQVEYCETLGTAGDICLVDMSKYRLIRKAGGVQQSSSIHVRFAQGENTFRATYRVDGQPVPRSAITPFKGTATLSPFVGLDTRA